MKLFKKKTKETKKFDFSGYDIRLSIKSICLFEKMTGKSFYEFTDVDVLTLVYCAFVTTNRLNYKLSTFMILIEDERIAEWMEGKFSTILDYLQQFAENRDNGGEGDERAKEQPFVSDLAYTLIVQYGVDANYVMNDLELWQIQSLFESAESMVHNRYEEERLWTYMTILPHIDGKKLNKPEKLIPFPWEKEEKKKKADSELKNNEYAVKHTIGMKIEDIFNGEG